MKDYVPLFFLLPSIALVWYELFGRSGKVYKGVGGWISWHFSTYCVPILVAALMICLELAYYVWQNEEVPILFYVATLIRIGILVIFGAGRMVQVYPNRLCGLTLKFFGAETGITLTGVRVYVPRWLAVSPLQDSHQTVRSVQFDMRLGRKSDLQHVVVRYEVIGSRFRNIDVRELRGVLETIIRTDSRTFARGGTFHRVSDRIANEAARLGVVVHSVSVDAINGFTVLSHRAPHNR